MTGKLPAKPANHPSVRAVLAKPRDKPSPVIDAAWLKEICLAAGADDAEHFDKRKVELGSPGVHMGQNALMSTLA